MNTTLRRPRDAFLVLALVALASGCAASSAGPGDQAQTRRGRGGTIITAQDIERFPSASTVEELLLFSGAGVTVRQGAPGVSGIQIIGRGGPPLWVVNGIPMTASGGGIGLNPRDVESIEVIRDGAATAEYGFRGANGVIFVRTKQ